MIGICFRIDAMHKLNVIQDQLSSEQTPSDTPWYKEGLRFKCTECGKCCTGTSGFVWVNEKEIKGMAEALQIDVPLFKRKYLRSRDNRYALVEKKTPSGEYDCIFLSDKKCQVYQARPVQCRTFPWWPEHLQSKEGWDHAALECEGINDQAPVIPYEEIQKGLEALYVNEFME